VSGHPTNYQLIGVFTACVLSMGFAVGCLVWMFA
jgi:hypothetical protein